VLAIDTGPACNNRCHGCPRVGDGPRDPGGDGAPLPPPPRDGAELVVHGGEPTLHPGFVELLAAARQADLALRVETNARAFASPGRAATAHAAGLTAATITLWGATAASHDFLTRTPGSFRQTVAGAMALRAAGVRLSFRLLLTRTALPELGAMTSVAIGLGAQALRLSWARMEPRPPGFAVPAPPAAVDDPADPKGPLRIDRNTPAGDRDGYDATREWLVPRYALSGEAVAAAVRGVARATRTGAGLAAPTVAVMVDGVPLCLLPPGALATPPQPSCHQPGGPTDRGDAFAAPCQGCAARTRCPGVPRGYLARFGDGELAPLPAAAGGAAGERPL